MRVDPGNKDIFVWNRRDLNSVGVPTVHCSVYTIGLNIPTWADFPFHFISRIHIKDKSNQLETHAVNHFFHILIGQISGTGPSALVFFRYNDFTNFTYLTCWCGVKHLLRRWKNFKK